MAFENIYDVSDLFNLKEGDLITKKDRNKLFTGKEVIILPKKG